MRTVDSRHISIEKSYLITRVSQPCSADTLRACYITLPSFQPSPETSISLTTNGKIAYNGDLQVNYCSPDKSLYDITWCDDDVEDDE